MKNKKTKTDSIVKSLIWEVSMFILITLAFWKLTGMSITKAIYFNTGVLLFKIVGLSFFDWAWERKNGCRN